MRDSSTALSWMPPPLATALPLASLLLFLLSCAPSAPDPTELLRQMQSALLDHDGFRYRFELQRLEASEPAGVAMTGEVTLKRVDLSGGKYLAEMRAEATSDSTRQSFAGVKTLSEVYVADPVDRVARRSSMYSAGSRLVAEMEPGFMYVFYDPRSLDDEVESAAHWEGVTTIGDTPCDLVRVEYEDDPEDSRWCIGRQDHLPRRLEWLEDGSGTRLDLRELVVDASLRANAFSAAPPAGYQVEVLSLGPANGTPVPDFELRLGDGSFVTVSELRGQVLVFDFWATWCAPCRASLAALERTAEAFKDQPVLFFAVNAMESLEPGEPLAFFAENGFTNDVVLEGDALHAFFAAGNLPALAVVGAAGESRGVSIGFHGEGSEEWTRQLIAGALASQEY